MARYALNKLGQGLITVFLLALVVFIASRVTGDPIQLLRPSETVGTAVDREIIEERLGLNGSRVEQFGRFIGGLARGDFGESFTYELPVWELFLQRFPNTIVLVVPAFLVAGAVGIPLGVITAVRRGGLIDRVANFAAVLGVSTPNFWLAIVLILVFAVGLGWFPAARMGGPQHYVLPVLTMSTFITAGMMRLVRSSMLEQLDSEYVKLARTKGIRERQTVWGHALRNSLLPAVAFAGTYASLLIGGSVAVETVFAWPGIGRLLYEAVIARDYPLAQGIIVLTGVLIIVLNIVTDLVYVWLDPRIR
jgi:ABC-type dipeptide/oligopeptide/nickel transport system permease component